MNSANRNVRCDSKSRLPVFVIRSLTRPSGLNHLVSTPNPKPASNLKVPWLEMRHTHKTPYRSAFRRGFLYYEASSEPMPGEAKRIYFLAFLLVAVVVAAQLHCCVELNSNTLDSHVCPICSSAGVAIAAPAVNMAIVPASHWLEVSSATPSISVVVLRNTAPRAPPAA